ncbi:unnamed protein product [Zymoseptoria tritici ST99CH_3D7]|uniref:CBM1 domain-containing protein n=1 Tax=Zymoseptoria tritici (strain ST99CH_3D7) TaxID=1276538 RepID=A0A1X7S2L7_ZYMT9|nr:unnamed protein product [Zymoseptoria tritici ST99CH_3D7]
MLSTLTLLLATIASLTAAACTSTSPSASAACYTSTTTVLDPTCTPWTGICPLMLCATPTATATAVVPAVTPVCELEDIPVVTKFRGSRRRGRWGVVRLEGEGLGWG